MLNDLKILRAIVETESQYCDFGVHFYHLCDNVGLSFALLKGYFLTVSLLSFLFNLSFYLLNFSHVIKHKNSKKD